MRAQSFQFKMECSFIFFFALVVYEAMALMNTNKRKSLN